MIIKGENSIISIAIVSDKYFKEQMNNHLSKTMDENLHKIFSQTLHNSLGLYSLLIEDAYVWLCDCTERY